MCDSDFADSESICSTFGQVMMKPNDRRLLSLVSASQVFLSNFPTQKGRPSSSFHLHHHLAVRAIDGKKAGNEITRPSLSLPIHKPTDQKIKLNSTMRSQGEVWRQTHTHTHGAQIVPEHPRQLLNPHIICAENALVVLVALPRWRLLGRLSGEQMGKEQHTHTHNLRSQLLLNSNQSKL